MNIPDKAVEAAARAIAPYSDDDDWQYNTSAAEDAIKAAAPFIAAQALRGEAKNWTAGNIRELMLIAADEMEAGK